MKKTNLLSSLILLSIILVTSCSKDSGSSSTTNTSSNPTNPSTCNFAPYRLGSKIEQIVNGSSSSFEVIKDTTINSEKYYTIGDKTTNISGMYIRVDNSGNVWQYIPQTVNNGVVIPSMNHIYLKPNENVGASWNYTVSSNISGGISYDNVYTFKIAEKNIVKVINGTSYNNCIKVNVNIKTVFQGNTISSYDLDYLWVCGFGYYSVTQNGSEIARVTKFTY